MDRVALIGRTNVGKSSIFNQIAERNLVVSGQKENLTVDWLEKKVNLLGLPFILLDTAGVNNYDDFSLITKNLDIIIFVLDGKSGLCELDRELLKILRKINLPTIFLVNKAEGKKTAEIESDLLKLSIDNIIEFSVKSGFGLRDLRDRLEQLMLKKEQNNKLLLDDKQELDEILHQEKPIRVSFIGRPNVGKSTLINNILGYGRVKTGKIPGTTRDAIETPFTYKGSNFILVDTAGIRKKSKLRDIYEKKFVSFSIKNIRTADYIVLICDINNPLERQELNLAALAARDLKPIIIVLNKSDTIANSTLVVKEIKRDIQDEFYQIKGIPVLITSAINKKGLKNIFKQLILLHRNNNYRISTPKLNNWLQKATQKNPPKLVGYRRANLKYMTQIGVAPMRFRIFSSHARIVTSYMRYLTNSLAEEFDLYGVGIKIIITKT